MTEQSKTASIYAKNGETNLLVSMQMAKYDCHCYLHCGGSAYTQIVFESLDKKTTFDFFIMNEEDGREFMCLLYDLQNINNTMSKRVRKNKIDKLIAILDEVEGMSYSMTKAFNALVMEHNYN
jgi:hypothetical protein